MYRIFTKRLILTLLVLLVLDLAVAPYISWGFARPSFLYLFIIYLAMEYDWQYVLPVAFAVGLLRDLTGGVYLGQETLILTALVFICERSGKNVTSGSLVFRLMVTFVFILAIQTINLIFLAVFNAHIFISVFNVSLAVRAALLNTLMMPVFLYLAKRFFDKKKRFHQYELFR